MKKCGKNRVQWEFVLMKDCYLRGLGVALRFRIPRFGGFCVWRPIPEEHTKLNRFKYV